MPVRTARTARRRFIRPLRVSAVGAAWCGCGWSLRRMARCVRPEWIVPRGTRCSTVRRSLRRAAAVFACHRSGVGRRRQGSSSTDSSWCPRGSLAPRAMPCRRGPGDQEGRQEPTQNAPGCEAITERGNFPFPVARWAVGGRWTPLAIGRATRRSGRVRKPELHSKPLPRQ